MKSRKAFHHWILWRSKFKKRFQIPCATVGCSPKATWFGVFISRHFLDRLIVKISFNASQIHMQWHSTSLQKFNREVRRLTNRDWGVSMRCQIIRLSQYLRGWINYFGIDNRYNQCVELDHWIRRRLRIAYWRQWRFLRTKIGKLIALDVTIETCCCMWPHKQRNLVVVPRPQAFSKRYLTLIWKLKACSLYAKGGYHFTIQH